MKTRAVAAEAAAEAPADGESDVDVVRTVPSVEAWALIASRGAMRYGNSAVPDPHPWSVSVLDEVKRDRGNYHSQSSIITIPIDTSIGTLWVQNSIIPHNRQTGRFAQRQSIAFILQ